MPRFRSTALGVAVGLAWSVPAVAQSQTGLDATGAVALTYTDNLYNAAADPEPGRPDRASAWYLTYTPGLQLSHQRQRATYQLAYAHSITQYLTTIDADAHGDMGSAGASYTLSPQDRLSLGLSGSRITNAFTLSDATTLGQLQTDSRSTIVTGAVTQSYTHEYSERWAGQQTAGIALSKATRGIGTHPLSMTLNGAIGPDYRLERDTWSFRANVLYYHLFSARRGELYTPRQRRIQAGPQVTWMHRFSEEWTSTLNAGVEFAHWMGASQFVEPEPRWGARLEWQRDPFRAGISYSGGATSNLYTQGLVYQDMVALDAGWVVLETRPRLELSTTEALARNDPASAPGMPAQPTLYVASSSTTLRLMPWEFLGFSLDYRHTRQFGANSNTQGFADYYRNDVILSVTGQWPIFSTGSEAAEGE